ncbi:phage tail protein [Serratia fonticola]|uniref:phage tail protein n=1 Tax=Serratia fonticola TaxID=47917 RepID=UPI001646B504|nr:phage tail protein [Serratia fonticola]MBC3250972.1 phage tail protein [Serratia fonticola]
MLLKQKLLREFLLSNVDYLTKNPEKLRIDIEAGSVAGGLAATLSHQHRYTASVLIMDWDGNTHVLFTLFEMWLRTHQPDIMATEEARKTGLTYMIQTLDNDLLDIKIWLKLTERVFVKNDGQAMIVTPKDEPPLPDGETDPWLLCDSDGKIVQRVTP